MSKRQESVNRTPIEHRNRPSTGRHRYRLPIVLLLLAALLVGGGTLLWQASSRSGTQPQPQSQDAPRVAVAPETIDHGDVQLGTPVRSVFNVSNVGTRHLQILGEPKVELVRGC